jgi:uncharacterized protein
MDHRTGRIVTGWDHCVQSLALILTTRIGQRVMRRNFGSAALDLQDRTASPRLIMEIYVAVSDAIRQWEPGFRLRNIQLTRAGSHGVFRFDMSGVFYPNGHLGDYSTREERSTALTLSESGAGVVLQ